MRIWSLGLQVWDTAFSLPFAGPSGRVFIPGDVASNLILTLSSGIRTKNVGHRDALFCDCYWCKEHSGEYLCFWVSTFWVLRVISARVLCKCWNNKNYLFYKLKENKVIRDSILGFEYLIALQAT